jgi:protein phosphatase
MPDSVDCFGLTDRGRVRDVNEDQFLVAELDKSMLVHQTSLAGPDHTRLPGGPRGYLFVVADGMGGVSGGKLASGLAVQTLTRYVLNTMPWFFRLDGDDDQVDQLRAALTACHQTVVAVAAETGKDRMGTTLTLAYVRWPRAYLIHAGDSRAYLLRGGHLHRLTRDHTIAQKLVDEGKMSPQLAEDSRWGHVLTNCICAGRTHLDPDVHTATLQPGDVLLLCSDGLSKCVADDRIAGLLAAGTAEEAARRLVAAANEAGGPDNVTVVAARFRGPAAVPDPTPPAPQR